MADYFSQSQNQLDSEKEPNSGLCCCEYIDHQNKHYHILACCCNCEDFDKVFTDWLTCRRIDRSRQRNMLISFQDRLRIPWQGGAKQVTFDTLAPVFVIPLLISIAAINAYTCIVIFLASSVIMCYSYNYIHRNAGHTSFFSIWNLSSLIYLLLLFEFTVPLLEVLPEENLVLALLSIISVICFWQTRKRAVLNRVIQPITGGSELPDIAETSVNEENETEQTTLLIEQDLDEVQSLDGISSNQPNLCATCRKSVPARTAHCPVCRACIKRLDHHSYWLNCCIGESNHRYYIVGMIFGALALIVGADLTLTAVCHPFLAANVAGVQILLPDDCTEIFEMYELSVAFVIAIYALIISQYILVMLVQQGYMISRGITVQEWKSGLRGNNKTVKYNCKSFVL
ncbi:palmitoyltransferase ZDHHC23-B isoform X1 [Bactrocera dorsalis]|uniref:Palmitoyltransferase n=2 Tax=Bactrocera dorsalis TaxID=27457 RepID=A0A6I9VAS4_BACDO|nr:palmitoyltransferase ZDHHC23-B isoform X1 [Bactrocera dorsalis]